MGRLLCTGGTLTVQIRTVDSQSGLRILLLLCAKNHAGTIYEIIANSKQSMNSQCSIY